jgi:hypothetical protein
MIARGARFLVSRDPNGEFSLALYQGKPVIRRSGSSLGINHFGNIKQRLVRCINQLAKDEMWPLEVFIKRGEMQIHMKATNKIHPLTNQEVYIGLKTGNVVLPRHSFEYDDEWFRNQLVKKTLPA